MFFFLTANCPAAKNPRAVQNSGFSLPAMSDSSSDGLLCKIEMVNRANA